MNIHEETLEIARSLIHKDPSLKDWVVSKFPELKESDDEKIKNEIIDYLKGFIPHHNDDLVAKSKLWIAWLEKQGEKIDVIENFDTEFEKQVSHLIASTINKEYEYTSDFVKWTANALLNYAKHKLEKQGEQKPVISDDALREGIAHFGITQYQIDNWLKKYVDVEKQGEQSIYDVPSRNMILAVWELGNEWKELTNGSISKEYGTQLEYIQKHWNESPYYLRDKQGEQKPTDKVEPKFKIGDWITIDNPCQIISIDGNYIVQYCDDETTREISKKFCESQFHTWTIQDATDGDVISFNDGHGNDCIELIKSIIGKKIEFWFCLTNGNCYEVFDGIIPYTNFASRKDATPATKEQRDLLFSKMKEAGYEWDAEKKELKKMKQKTTKLPNGEDYGIDSLYHAARILEKTLGEVEGYQSDDGILEHKCAIEAVNRLYKQKPAWSEDDEQQMKSCLDFLDNISCGDDSELNDCRNWLKSIKERMKGE